MNTPVPTAYTLKTSFEANPTISNNTRTTNFRTQSPRKAHAEQYQAGKKSPRQAQMVPGPGTYSYKNLSIANEGLKYTLKSRTKNTFGKPASLLTLQSPSRWPEKCRRPDPATTRASASTRLENILSPISRK